MVFLLSLMHVISANIGWIYSYIAGPQGANKMFWFTFEKFLCLYKQNSIFCFPLCRLTPRCGTKHCSSVHGHKANAQVGVVLKREIMCSLNSFIA